MKTGENKAEMEEEKILLLMCCLMNVLVSCLNCKKLPLNLQYKNSQINFTANLSSF